MTTPRRIAAPRTSKPRTTPGEKLGYFVSATIKVLKANSGMFLSSLAVVLLVLVACGDLLGGTTLQGIYDFPVVVLQLVGLWLMVTGIAALDAIPRVNKSFNGAEGMLLWNKIGTILGLIVVWVAYVMRRNYLGSTHNTVDFHISDTVLLVALCVMMVLLVLRYVGPNMRHAPRRGSAAWIARLPFDIIYPAFNAATVVFWGILAWHMWETSILQHNQLPWLLAAYCLVLIAAALVILHVMVYQQVRTDRRYPGTVVRLTYPNPHTVIVNVELEQIMQRGRPVSYWYTAGQYSYLGVPGSKSAPHPFTMTSIPNVVGRTGPTTHVGVGSRMRTQGIAWDRTIEYCIKAGGKGSQWLVENLHEGMSVTVSTPRGGTHPAHGGVRQLWVAGGIGITPFIAWLRDLDLNAGKDFPGHVTLVWSYHPSDNPPYLSLVRQCAQDWDWLTLVEVDTEVGERLTAQEAHRIAFPLEEAVADESAASALTGAAAVVGEAAPLYGEDITIHMCGPTDLCGDYYTYFLEQGVSPDRMHVDAFHMR